MNNNPTNYANRRRSPSPSVRKSPAVGHQTTNLAMGATHQQHRPNNVSSARSSYHAGCQHSNQSRIPVYQRNQSFDTVQSLWVFQNLLIVLDFFFSHFAIFLVSGRLQFHPRFHRLRHHAPIHSRWSFSFRPSGLHIDFPTTIQPWRRWQQQQVLIDSSIESH